MQRRKIWRLTSDLRVTDDPSAPFPLITECTVVVPAQKTSHVVTPAPTLTVVPSSRTQTTDVLDAVNVTQSRWMRRLTILFADVVGFASAFGILYLIVANAAPGLIPLIWGGAAVVPFVLVAYAVAGLYEPIRLHPSEEMRLASLTTITIGLTAALTSYAASMDLPTALFIAAAGGLGAMIVPACRGFFRILFARTDWWGTATVVIGPKQAVDTVTDTLRRWPELGLYPVAVLSDDPAMCDDALYAGSTDEALHLARQHGLPCAVVVEPKTSGDERDRLIARYSKFYDQVLVVPDVEDGVAALWSTGRSHQGLLGYGISHFKLRPWSRAAKRAVDVVGAGILTLLALPVLAVIAILIKLDSEGGIFYQQDRMGREGRCFSVLKFRTMKLNADGILKDILDRDPELRREYEQFHKLQNDPRVTTVGKVLRRFSLDELPQLINVLRGEMSLVGPRAYMPRELPKMKSQAQIVLQTPPGITGLWQVSGRNALSFERRVDLDVHYFKNWSPWLDLYLLIRTIPVVLSGDGAS